MERQLHWLVLYVVITARAGSAQGQEPGFPLWILMWVSGTQVPVPSSAAFPRTSTGSRIGNGTVKAQSGTRTGHSTSSSSLIHYATTPIPTLEYFPLLFQWSENKISEQCSNCSEMIRAHKKKFKEKYLTIEKGKYYGKKTAKCKMNFKIKGKETLNLIYQANVRSGKHNA